MPKENNVINRDNTLTPQGALLYRTLWRWHFYAGIFCIPFVLTLSLSGLLYLFKPQIDGWVDHPYHQLEARAERTSPEAQINAALDAVPNSRFLKYTLVESELHAVIINLSDPDGERILVYVNPYTLEILKNIRYEKQFMRLVRTFHGELLAGNTGSILVELAGNWTIVLILTGLYLAWPRQHKGLAGILYPRLILRGRSFWKDLHRVLGIWVSIFALFLLVTGLPWSLAWSSAFKEVRTWFEETPTLQEWTVSRSEEKSNNISLSADNIQLSETVVAQAQSLNLAAPAELSIDNNRPGQWKLTSSNQNRLLRTQAWIESETGEIVEIKPYSDRKPLDLAIGVGISAHEGQLFGWFNQLLGVFTAISLIFISISGFIMWRKRKPQDTLGAPIIPAINPHEKTVTTFILICAIFLPLLAISIVTILIIEFFIFRRLNYVRQWLGIVS